MANTKHPFQKFADHVISVLQPDPRVIGLAVAGSWTTGEMDEYSDIDFILVTKDKLSGKEEMLSYANKFGDLVSAFTGEHVAEPRLLICLYSNPLLHVDIKFLTPDELRVRVDDPVLLLDKELQLFNVLQGSAAAFPFPDYQWIEDRFWTWIHYLLMKTGRGEYFEAVDFLAYLRMMVFGPLLHISNGNLPKGVRRVETLLSDQDLASLKLTVANHDKASLITAIVNAVSLYKRLRTSLYEKNITLQIRAEEQVTRYIEKL